MKRIPPDTLFRIGGLAACLAAGIAQASMLWYAGPQAVPYAFLPAWRAPLAELLADAAPARLEAVFHLAVTAVLLGTLAFAAAFRAATRPAPAPRSSGPALLAVQTLLGLLLDPDLLYIVAVELPFVFPDRRAHAWLGVQMAVLVATRSLPAAVPEDLYCSVAGIEPPPSGIGEAMALLGASAWQLFAFVVGTITVAERRRRAELARANTELLATQQLLAESSRAGERQRIARDLHDGLGHHLTALGLHLELAARQSDGAAAEAVATARDIARRLLAEVRTTVGVHRHEQPLDLRQALHTLCSGIPFPRIRLRIAEDFAVTDPAMAHAIFRSVQEALSNALRHAEAKDIEVALSCDDAGLSVRVTDDGRGNAAPCPGNGLQGMRERVEACGGQLQLAGGDGFAVHIRLPAGEPR